MLSCVASLATTFSFRVSSPPSSHFPRRIQLELSELFAIGCGMVAVGIFVVLFTLFWDSFLAVWSSAIWK